MNSVSAAFLTTPKLPEAFCYKTVRPCEPVSVNCPTEPEKLHCSDRVQINKAIKATKLQALAKDSMEQQRSADGKEAFKLVLKAALFLEFHSYIKNANHSIENLTNNGELETCDRLDTTLTSLENLLNSTLGNLKHCDCEKETEFELYSVKQNAVEEYELECSRCISSLATNG